jgi:hypothetical protein
MLSVSKNIKEYVIYSLCLAKGSEFFIDSSMAEGKEKRKKLKISNEAQFSNLKLSVNLLGYKIPGGVNLC